MATSILDATPIVFDYINSSKNLLGFSAEQLYEIDPYLVNLDHQGRPDSIREIAVIAHLVVICQRQEARIARLEQQLGVDHG